MKSVLNAADRRELTNRIMKLTPDQTPSWGKMTAPQMVVHLSDCLQMAFGRLEVASKNLPLRYTPLKQLMLYWVPFPKGVPTAPELIARAPGEWQAAVGELRALMDQCGTCDPGAPWPEHPAFGHLTGKQWGVLIYRHTDHHLRQFGV
jgi:DinB superfamily